MVRIPRSVLSAARDFGRDLEAARRIGLEVESRDVAIGARAPLLVTGFTPGSLFQLPSPLRDPTVWTGLLAGGFGSPSPASVFRYADGSVVQIPRRPHSPPPEVLAAAGGGERTPRLGNWLPEQIRDLKRTFEVLIGEDIGRFSTARRGFYEPTKPRRYHPVAVVFRHRDVNILLLPPEPFLLSEDHTFIRGVQTPQEFQRMQDMAPQPPPGSPDQSLLSFLYHPSYGVTFSNRTDNPHDCMRWGFARLKEYSGRHGIYLERTPSRKLPKGLISFDRSGQGPTRLAFTSRFNPKYFRDQAEFVGFLRDAARALRFLGLSESAAVYYEGRTGSVPPKLTAFLNPGSSG